EEPPGGWPAAQNFGQMRSVLGDLRGIGVEVPGRPKGSLRDQYLQRAAELEAKERSGECTVDDRINLSAYYIRLLQYAKAVEVLHPMVRVRRPHFMALANLATAYELQGIPERALSYHEQALAVWPRLWPGWNVVYLNWYRRLEKYHLTLLRLRMQEARRPP